MNQRGKRRQSDQKKACHYLSLDHFPDQRKMWKTLDSHGCKPKSIATDDRLRQDVAWALWILLPLAQWSTLQSHSLPIWTILCHRHISQPITPPNPLQLSRRQVLQQTSVLRLSPDQLPRWLLPVIRIGICQLMSKSNGHLALQSQVPAPTLSHKSLSIHPWVGIGRSQSLNRLSISKSEISQNNLLSAMSHPCRLP